MAERTCHNCVYACFDPGRWLRSLALNEPLLPRCANHPRWPGRLHDVPGVPCPSYRPRPAEAPDDARRIPLGDGQYALVDADDYEQLSQFTWHFHNGYAMRWENRREVYMHRHVTEPPKGMVVDHINHNKLDNRRANLRVCTRRENVFNQPSKRATTSPFKGVSYRTYPSGRRTCYAEIRIDGKKTYLGSFGTEADAARAYDRAAVEHHGDFAHLNFPDEWPPTRRAELRAQQQNQASKPARGKKGAKRKKAQTHPVGANNHSP